MERLAKYGENEVLSPLVWELIEKEIKIDETNMEILLDDEIKIEQKQKIMRNFLKKESEKLKGWKEWVNEASFFEKKSFYSNMIKKEINPISFFLEKVGYLEEVTENLLENEFVKIYKGKNKKNLWKNWNFEDKQNGFKGDLYDLVQGIKGQEYIDKIIKVEKEEKKEGRILGTSLIVNENEIYKFIKKTDDDGQEIETKSIVVKPIPSILEIIEVEGVYKITLELGDSLKEIDFSIFTTVDKVKQLFPFQEFVYKLTKNESVMFGNWLMKRNKDRLKKELDYLGIKENELISIGKSYKLENNKLISVENNYYSTSNTINIDFVEENLIDSEKNYLKEVLPYFRGLEGWGWFVACYFNDDNITTPILGSFGTTNEGKSEGMEIMQKIFTTSPVKLPCRSLTEAQIKRHMSITNTLPLVIDDYKHGEKYKFDVESLMRALFEGDTMYQATITKKMFEYKLRRPVTITGENPLSNMSSNNRVIPLSSSKVEHENYILLKDTDIINKLGKEVLKTRLTYSENKIFDLYRDKEKELRNSYSDLDGRTISSLAWIKLGLMMLDKVLNSSFEHDYDYKALVEKRGITDIKGWIKEVIQIAKESENSHFKHMIKENHLSIEENSIKFNRSKFYEGFLDLKKKGLYAGEDITMKSFYNQCSKVADNKTLPIRINATQSKGYIIEIQ